MQRIAPIQCGSKYAIGGKEVEVVSIFYFGPAADFAKVVTLEGNDGSCYKLTQWSDGMVYRVTKDAGREHA